MSDKLMANELLAFLQQKLDVMDEVSAVQICSSTFSQDDIAAAKTLLFESLNKRDRMVSHRRDGTKKSLQEIITLLKETDPDDVPTFVARDLNKLPPVTFDHVDVTSLLKDILLLKQGLADTTRRLDVSEHTVGELRKEVDSLRAALAVSRSTDRADSANINLRRGACFNASAASFESAVFASSPKSDSVVSATRASPSPRDAAVPPSPAPRRPTPVPSKTRPTPAKSQQKDFAAAVASSSSNTAARTGRTVPKKAPVTAPARVIAEDRDDEGFILVQKKKRTQRAVKNHCGTAPTGPNLLLRAAAPSTAIYLSRLHYTTKVQDIADYIRTKSNISLRVQPLESSHNANFKAFVVRVPTTMLHTMMETSYWPKGVVYRRFRGRLPPAPPTV